MKKIATLPTKTPNERMHAAEVPTIADRLKDVRAWAILTHEALIRHSDYLIDHRPEDGQIEFDDQAVTEAIQHVQMQASESIFWIMANVDPKVLELPAPTDQQLEHIGGVNPHQRAREATGGGQ